MHHFQIPVHDIKSRYAAIQWKAGGCAAQQAAFTFTLIYVTESQQLNSTASGKLRIWTVLNCRHLSLVPHRQLQFI